MDESLIVPDAAIKFILLQRTSLLRIANHLPLWRLSGILPQIYSLIVAGESLCFRRHIKAGFSAIIRRDFQQIQPFLPSRCRSVLDIGCGIAAINIPIHTHYVPVSPDFYLLDRNDTDRSIHYGFRPRSSFYNSLAIAKEMLVQNGVEAEKIHLLEANENNDIALSHAVDLVLSLASWGFHYPVDTYLPEVDRVLSPKGAVILDIRKGTDGMAQLKRSLKNIHTIGEYEKYVRVCAKR